MTADDARVATPVGDMRLIDYLPARNLEITVHSLDLATAADLPVPPSLISSVPEAIELCVGIGSDAQRLRVLSAITGRGGLDHEFTVL